MEITEIKQKLKDLIDEIPEPINLEFGLISEDDLKSKLQKDWENALIELDEAGISLKWRMKNDTIGYFIEWNRIKTPELLLHWLHHITQKTWPLTTSRRIYHFIECVCEKNGWNIHAPKYFK